MPRGYDSYLMAELCQSESDGEPVTSVSEVTPARRPSLGQALPKIPVKIEGWGVSITLKAGPHVRWHKLLDKWKSCFPDPLSAPMAWPVIVNVGEEEVRVSSIQESISRTIGPERLERLGDDIAFVFVSVGRPEKMDSDDVSPPVHEHEQNAGSEESADPTPGTLESVDLQDLEIHTTEFPSVKVRSPEEPSRSIKVVIESQYSKKKAKLNVSSNCLISRLIRKWTEASGIRIDPDKFGLVLNGETVLCLDKTLGECLPCGDSERVNLEAKLTQELKGNSPPKTARKRMERSPKSPQTRKSRKKESAEPTPPTTVNNRSQQAEFEFWSQAKSQGLSTELVMPTSPNGEEEWADDEEALAIALSLSELQQ